MDHEALLQLVQEALPGVRFERTPSADAHPTVYIDRDAVPEVMHALCTRTELAFTFLSELTAIDFWPREPRYEVVYVLVSLEHRLRLRVKVRLTGEDAHIADVSRIWPAANWLEREVWDLFGIEFDGHPDPRRLLMPEDWEGYPLRKDYPVQIKLPARTTEPMQVSEQEFRENLMRDRLVRER
jgi:NADH-quinone oxidoreductase subunit C